ncbi:MAG TPA: CPBP family intramembrane glutamic endopeptidase [Gaiellaceae bacterium]|nr:CPBP family intramembrane glutamic endopeptidase [Gaiellaceae bacterium]
MNERSDTAPAHGRDDVRRLALWLLLVAILIALGYAARGSSNSDSQLLYHWSTAIGAIVQDGIILALVLAIAGQRRDLLALRRPAALAQAGWILAGAIVAVYVFEGIYSALTHPGNEQGLTPSHWEPHRAAQYVVNAIVICTFVPFVEELTYRGLGFSVLERFGKWPAILGVGVLFGLAHGLLLSLPILIAFGCILAWIRATTRSVVPGMVLHGTFNLIALIAAVTLHR